MNIFSMNSPLARGINKLVMMLYAGVLWFICSLPVVTAGAASAAMYEVLLKAARNEEGYIASSFFRAFKENLSQGIRVWLPILLAQILFSVNLFYYGVLGAGQFRIQAVIFALLLFITLALSSYIFPIMAKFENTAGGHFGMAAALMLRNPGWTLLLVAIQLMFLFTCWFFVYLPVVFSMGIWGYVQAVIFNHIFDRLTERGIIVENGAQSKKTQENTAGKAE